MVTSTSYIYNHGPEVNTRAVVSQKVRLFSYMQDLGAQKNLDNDLKRSWVQIGTMTSFQVSESRNVEEVRAIGSGDRIMELIPGVTSASIQANRVALWLSNLMQVFGYKAGVSGVVRSLRQHRWPFDIRQELVTSDILKAPNIFETVEAGLAQLSKADVSKKDKIPSPIPSIQQPPVEKVIVTIYEGCWMESYGITFASDQAAVQENCSIKCSDIVAAFEVEFDEPDYLDSNKKRAFRVSE